MRKSGGVGLGALSMRHFGFLLKESGGRVEETLFPWTSGVQLQRLLDIFAALFQSFIIGKFPELVITGHGSSPVRYGALWIAGGCDGKAFLGWRVLERVQQRDALFDRGLDFRRATGREIHLAELSAIRSRRARFESKKKDEQPEGGGGHSLVAHDASPIVPE